MIPSVKLCKSFGSVSAHRNRILPKHRNLPKPWFYRNYRPKPKFRSYTTNKSHIIISSLYSSYSDIRPSFDFFHGVLNMYAFMYPKICSDRWYVIWYASSLLVFMKCILGPPSRWKGLNSSSCIVLGYTLRHFHHSSLKYVSEWTSLIWAKKKQNRI